MRSFVAAVALLSSSCDSASTAKDEATDAKPRPEIADLAMVCEQAKAAKGSSDADRSAFASAVEKKAHSTPMKRLLGAVATVPDAHKLFYFKAGAKEMGAPDWDCPELANVYGEQKDERYQRDHAADAEAGDDAARKPEVAADESKAEPPVPAGELNKATIRDAIKAHTNAVRKCYETELLEQPDLAGKVEVSIEIGQDGKVLKASASGLHPAVDECVGKVIEGVRFPEHDQESPVTVVYPFTFEGKKG